MTKTSSPHVPHAAVVGWPVGHSLSPRIFRTFRAVLGRPLYYRALSLRPDHFAGTLQAATEDSWIGWNVTLPHKVAALELVDEADASAREAGAVNVIRFKKDRRIGYNTDAEGFLAPLARRGLELKGRSALVLGAGGAARAVCAALRRSGVRELWIVNRTAEKSMDLAKAFGGKAAPWAPAELERRAAAADVVVNATSLGLGGKGQPLPVGARFKRGAWAYDLVYRPLLTPFLRAARDQGAEIVGGLGMLVAQAGATWRIWFGETISQGLLEQVEAELHALVARGE